MNETIINIFGTIATWGYSKNYVKYFLDQSKGPVRVKVTSYGGDVNEAIAISQLFAEHGNVTVEFIGFNASAVTWMAFGAKNIEIHEDTFQLVHKCSMPVDIYGNLNSDQIEDKIKDLQNAKEAADAINLVIAKKYLDRCAVKGKSIKDVLGLMAESKWMKAEDILEWGFADKILPGINKSVTISNDLRTDFIARGLPVPVLDSKTTNESDNFLQQIKNWFDSIRKENTNQNQYIMNKDYLFINQILKIDGLNEKEGVVSLNLEQLKTLNEAIKKTLDEKKEAENSYEMAIKAVDGLSDDVKNAATIEDKVQVIKDVIERIPSVKTHTNPHDDGVINYKDIAIDPINNYGNSDED